MSKVQGPRVNRYNGAVIPGDVGEIQSLEQPSAGELVVGADLQPGAAAASLPPPGDMVDSAIEPLTRFLGPLLTVGSPAWSGDPVPVMRGLQKCLVEHALTLPEEARGPCLGAINVMESNVKWRLRYQQMRMTELEMMSPPEKGKGQ